MRLLRLASLVAVIRAADGAIWRSGPSDRTAIALREIIPEVGAAMSFLRQDKLLGHVPCSDVNANICAEIEGDTTRAKKRLMAAYLASCELHEGGHDVPRECLEWRENDLAGCEKALWRSPQQQNLFSVKMQEVQRECYARARTNDADKSFAALQHIIDVTTRLHETMTDTSADLRAGIRTEMANAHGQLTGHLERVRKDLLDASKIRDDAWLKQVRNAVATFGQDLATHLSGVMGGLRDDARAVFGQEAALFRGEMESSLSEHRDGLNDLTDGVRARAGEAADQAERARDSSEKTLQLHEDIRLSVQSTMNETQEALADVRTMAGMFSAPILFVRRVLEHRIPVAGILIGYISFRLAVSMRSLKPFPFAVAGTFIGLGFDWRSVLAVSGGSLIAAYLCYLMIEDGKLRRELHREQVAFRRRFFAMGDEDNAQLVGLVPRSPPPYKA